MTLASSINFLGQVMELRETLYLICLLIIKAIAKGIDERPGGGDGSGQV